MRSQSAVFVDAGYFIAAAATRRTGSSLRRLVSVNYESFVADLTRLVEERTGLPLLRVYWYDAGKNGLPDYEQEKVARLPKVKLRLGRIDVEGGQKGVDLRIGLDMVGHSRNRAVDVIYLLSGDDDLTEAVEEAQAQGVQVIILAVPTAQGGPHGVSRNLSMAADGIEILPSEIIDRSVAPVVSAPPTSASRVTPQVMRKQVTPADVRRSATAAKPAVPSTVVYSSGGEHASYVAPEYEGVTEELSRAITGVVGRTFDAWSSSATEIQRNDLLRGRPTIPSDLDRALLVDLADVMSDYNLSDEARVELRIQFWKKAEEALDA